MQLGGRWQTRNNIVRQLGIQPQISFKVAFTFCQKLLQLLLQVNEWWQIYSLLHFWVLWTQGFGTLFQNESLMTMDWKMNPFLSVDFTVIVSFFYPSKEDDLKKLVIIIDPIMIMVVSKCLAYIFEASLVSSKSPQQSRLAYGLQLYKPKQRGSSDQSNNYCSSVVSTQIKLGRQKWTLSSRGTA